MEQVGDTVKKKANLQECEKYTLKIDVLTIEKDFEGLLIYTNYANSLDACGGIEALRIYREAIELNPLFAMALGNYGRALRFYANTVNDSGHS